MSLFNELKRRNVFKMAIAYVVASWLALQITDVLMSVLTLPDTAGKFVFLLLVIGFIPTLVFSWAYEVTPEGIKKESEVDRSESMTTETAARLNKITIGLLVAVAAMVLVDRFMPGKEKGSESFSQEVVEQDSKPAEEKKSLAPDATPSVAVLPFVNMSSDEENEYFSDGISEELLNLLVRIEGLRVPSRTSSFSFKGQNSDIRDIARQLEVNHILEGSVRKAGNTVRVTAQLIDVTTDTHLWSDTYDRELEDIFVIQDEIAGHIVEALQVALAPGSTVHTPTTNMEAYNLYLQGKQLFWRREEHLINAEKFLRQAVELDPEFAEAWATLALTYVTQPNYLFVPLEDVEPLALEAADRAEALDPNLAEPDLARGNIAGKKSRLLEATELYERAARKAPKSAIARLWYGIALLNGGYFEEGHAQLSIARDLDPAAGIMLDWLSRAQYLNGHTGEALINAERGLSLGRIPSAITLLHHHYKARDLEAIEVLSSRLGVLPYWQSWGWIIRVEDQPELRKDLDEWVRTNIQAGNTRAYWLQTNIDLYLGGTANAIKLLSESIIFDATIYTILWWQDVAHVRQHPAFKEFAYEHGLVELWQTRGWPDLCRPLGEDDFECD